MKKAFISLSSATILSLGAIIMVLPAKPAAAQEIGSVYYYATPEEYKKNEFQWELFFENQHREPCQHYVEPPAGFEVVGCRLTRIQAPAAVSSYSSSSVSTIEPAAGDAETTTVIESTPSSYTVYFDFDKYSIRPSEAQTLGSAAADINKNSAAQVTVAGHADTSGTHAYNQSLSERRAIAVKQALTGNGVTASVIETEAYGETQPAVATGDGVPMQDNRRVVIEFDR